jgi:hypothetical protein
MRLSPETEELILQKWRVTRRPKHMRRASAVGITKSTSRVLEFTCICGASISCCNAFKRTKRVDAFLRDHEIPCALSALADKRWRGV